MTKDEWSDNLILSIVIQHDLGLSRWYFSKYPLYPERSVNL